MRDTEFIEKLVAINRITKVVKGGRRFGFAALVVVGNQKGSIGIGQGKSKSIEFLEENKKLLSAIEKQVIEAINKED